MKYFSEKYLNEVFDEFSPNYAGELDEQVMSRAEFKKAIASMSPPVTVYTDHQIGFAIPTPFYEAQMPLISPPFPEAQMPLIPTPFPKIKCHKEFIDETLEKLPGSVEDYEAFLPDTDRVLFKEDVYKGLNLNFSAQIPMYYVGITRKKNH